MLEGRWPPLVTLGGRWSRLEGDAGHARGTAGALLRLGAGVPRGPLCLPSVVEVKYASRCPPYIAGSELFSQVSWCESQLLIGSFRFMSIRETPGCLGRFDVRYTFNPRCIIGMRGMCHPGFTARLTEHLLINHRESVKLLSNKGNNLTVLLVKILSFSRQNINYSKWRSSWAKGSASNTDSLHSCTQLMYCSCNGLSVSLAQYLAERVPS